MVAKNRKRVNFKLNKTIKNVCGIKTLTGSSTFNLVFLSVKLEAETKADIAVV